MSNLAQDVLQLKEEVAELKAGFEEERAARRHDFWRIIWKLRRFRAAIIRLEDGISGERWHKGREYTRGSRLLIPGKPFLLEFKQKNRAVSGFRSPQRSNAYKSITDEDILNGRRNGLPGSV
jgi:hypothetical protein